MERTTLSDYQRGWADGQRHLVRLIVSEMRAKRRGATPSIDMYHFDALVERDLTRTGFPPDPGPDPIQDEREQAGVTSEPPGRSSAGEGRTQ